MIPKLFCRSGSGSLGFKPDRHVTHGGRLPLPSSANPLAKAGCQVAQFAERTRRMSATASLFLPTHSNGRAVRGSVADGLGAMPALRRTEIAGELAALNGRLVDLLLTNAPRAELEAVQAQVQRLLDQLEEASEPPVGPGDASQPPDPGFA